MTDDGTHHGIDEVEHDRHWWRQAVVYQIYPRSFADADGDGIGDLPGVVSRVPYLAELGVDAVWLSPFYPSELADGGYDVADHRDVDPRLGTLQDFDAMVDALHSVGIQWPNSEQSPSRCRPAGCCSPAAGSTRRASCG